MTFPSEEAGAAPGSAGTVEDEDGGGGAALDPDAVEGEAEVNARRRRMGGCREAVAELEFLLSLAISKGSL